MDSASDEFDRVQILRILMSCAAIRLVYAVYALFRNICIPDFQLFIWQERPDNYGLVLVI
jgi:hypothetical protein